MAIGQSLVAQWNEVLLEAIRSGGASPTETTYHLHLTSAAVYDAWAAYHPAASGHYSQLDRPESEHDLAHKAAAVSYAAYAMLSHFFPARQAQFDAFMDQLGYDRSLTGTDPSTAAGLGNLAAQNVLAARSDDGSNAESGYADTTGYEPVNSPDPADPSAPGGSDFDPNAWQPLRVPTGTVVDQNGVPIVDPDDPASYEDQIALTPHWGSVDAFALETGDQFRPEAPPELGNFDTYVDAAGNVTTYDQAWRDQFTEVLNASADLSTEQKVIAEYWADGPRTESPPGHWNQIAQDIALREGHGIDEDAKLFFAVNAAVFDAGIATWEAKFHYDFVRPQSAIRDLYFGQQVEAWGGPNMGTQTILGQEWQPYQNVTFVTPPFPEFVSGHSAFSMAAAHTIAAFVGSDQFYDGTTQGNYDLDDVEGIDLLGQYVATELVFENWQDSEPVVLQWDTLTEAAEEAGISRIYGGIHIQDGNLRALELGEQVAAQAEIYWQTLFTRGGDDLLFNDPAGGLIMAGAGDDTVYGRSSSDEILGGSGDDILYGRRASDILSGEDGNDLLRGGRGNDYIEGGDGNDILRAGRGQDVLDGGAGADQLFGRHGKNVLIGGEGWDILKGGSGEDRFVFHADDGPGVDTIRRFDADNDWLLLRGFDDGATIQTMAFDGDTAIMVDGRQIATLENIDPEDLVLGETIRFEDTPLT